MTKRFALIALLLGVARLGLGDGKVNSAAPNFQVKDALQKIHSLGEYRGSWVVLEWYNKQCPYVKKHYGSGNMQKLQKTYAEKGVKWLTVISSAPGKQGYLTAEQAVANATNAGSKATSVLLDSDGAVGKAYGAKTTPHIFVIDPKGTLVYEGAIDDNDSADPSVIATSKNYVVAALDAGMTGKAITVKTSKPYGCSVKY